MGDVVEAIAKDLLARSKKLYSENEHELPSEKDVYWEVYKREARVAIEALRRIEPTQKMIDAAWRADPLRCDVTEADKAEVYTAIWDAMIGELR